MSCVEKMNSIFEFPKLFLLITIFSNKYLKHDASTLLMQMCFQIECF